jgi:DNA-binding NtrC family response regulator
LINICERLVVMAHNRRVRFEDLPGSIRKSMTAEAPDDPVWHPDHTLSQMVADLEKKVLTAALEKGKTQASAAKLLGINQSTIARKMQKYGLDRSGWATKK